MASSACDSSTVVEKVKLSWQYRSGHSRSVLGFGSVQFASGSWPLELRHSTCLVLIPEHSHGVNGETTQFDHSRIQWSIVNPLETLALATSPPTPVLARSACHPVETSNMAMPDPPFTHETPDGKPPRCKATGRSSSSTPIMYASGSLSCLNGELCTNSSFQGPFFSAGNNVRSSGAPDGKSWMHSSLGLMHAGSPSAASHQAWP